MRLCIVDDHAMIRKTVRMMAEQAGFDVVGEGSTGVDAVRLAHDLKPDMVILDLNMPEMGGREAIGKVLEESPETKVIVLTVEEDDNAVAAALKAGACGFVTKASTIEELDIALRAVWRDGGYVSPDVARRLMDALRKGDAEVVEQPLSLTEREAAVLTALGRGLSARRVAANLGITEGTVHTHIANIYRKLAVTNRNDALREGKRRQIITLPD